MNLFYVPKKQIHSSFLEITGQEATHISKVLRYGVGDEIYVTDGIGACYRCRITALSGRSIRADITNKTFENPSVPEISLAVGIIKKRDRLEFAIEKTVELGVSRLILFEGDHSVKSKVREQRLGTLIEQAMKQSLRFYLPEFKVLRSIDDVLKQFGDVRILAADEKSSQETIDIPSAQSVLGLVGPEGGFSSRERQLFNSNGVRSYSLGSKRLRAETAAVVFADRLLNNCV